MAIRDAASFTLVTTTTTIPSITTSYSTTYLLESIGSSTTDIKTISTLWFTTIPASTVTSINVWLITSSTSSTAGSSTFITSTTSSSTSITSTTGSSTANSTSVASSVHPIDTTVPLPTGVTVVQKASSSKTTAIVVGILVPLTVICIIAMVLIFRKRKKRKKRKTRDASTGYTIKHWFDKTEDEPPKRGISPPPLPPIAPSGAELEAEHGPYRVASPPRPTRPRSIPESVLNVMSQSSGPGSNVADAATERSQTPIELAHLRSPTSLSDNDSTIFIPNTDNTPVYDGTRRKYLKTALEHNMPLAQLTRPSLRVPNAPPPTQQNAGGMRRSTYFPEPLKIHKRSVSDANAPSARGRYVANPEEDQYEYPSPVPTEQEFIANVRRGLSKTPPLQSATADRLAFMADASSEEGSFAQANEINRKREESLATLEGRTPASASSSWSTGQGRADFRDAFAPRVPPRVRGPIPEDQLAARRKGNVIDEGVVNEWV